MSMMARMIVSPTPGSPAPDFCSFMDAVAEGDVDRVRALAASTPSLVHCTDHRAFDAQPIVVAAWKGDLEMIDALLALGANINCRSHWWAGGFGVLHTFDAALGDALIERGAELDVHSAASLGKKDELIRLLDADPVLIKARGGDGQTPLHFAANPEIAEILLDRFADIDARDVDHESTSAQWAASSRPKVCEYLWASGAEGDVFMASAIGDITMLNDLCTTDADLDRRITDETFPCHGSEAGHIYMHTLGRNASPLHVAARFDHDAAAAWLLLRGADVNVIGDYDECTPLHVCAWSGSTRAARVLIEQGADLDRDSGPLHRNAPLGWAIVAGRADMVDLLVDSGAPRRDFYVDDAQAGLDGDLRRISAGTADDYRRIIARLQDSP